MGATSMEIHIYRNGVEQGPFDEDTVTRMLADGRLMPFDRAWYAGLPGWLPLSQLLPLRPAPADEAAEFATRPAAPPDEEPPAPATAKQKAFLTYMGVSFRSGITREEAAALVTAIMESPAEAARLAKWNDERLRLHPDIFASEVRAWKANRPARFHELVQREGADVFQDVSKAHCQVLVTYLDVKFPNWDARESEATWNYFFPAIAEKFPQLVKKAWRGQLHFPDGPKVAYELTHHVPPVPSLRSTPHLLARATALVLLLTALASAAYYVSENPHVIFRWRKPPPDISEAPQPPSSTVAPVVSGPEAPTPPPAPAVVVEKPVPTPAPAPPRVALATPVPTPPPPIATPAPTPAPIAAKATPAPTPYPFQSPPQAPALPMTATVPPVMKRKDILTVTRPVDVTLKFGRLQIPRGAAVKVVSHDGPIVNVIYMNNTVAIPLSATDAR